MTNRDVLSLAIKIAAIFMMLLDLFIVETIGWLILGATDPRFAEETGFNGVLGVAMMVLIIAMVVILIAKSDALARWLIKKEKKLSNIGLSKGDCYEIALALMGIYFILTALGSMFYNLRTLTFWLPVPENMRSNPDFNYIFYSVRAAQGQIIRLISGALLIGFSRKIEGWLTRKPKKVKK